jgi:hypothetical protein
MLAAIIRRNRFAELVVPAIEGHGPIKAWATVLALPQSNRCIAPRHVAEIDSVAGHIGFVDERTMRDAVHVRDKGVRLISVPPSAGTGLNRPASGWPQGRRRCDNEPAPGRFLPLRCGGGQDGTC